MTNTVKGPPSVRELVRVLLQYGRDGVDGSTTSELTFRSLAGWSDSFPAVRPAHQSTRLMGYVEFRSLAGGAELGTERLSDFLEGKAYASLDSSSGCCYID